MNRQAMLTSITLIILLSSSGCADIVEPNQLAFVIGSAIDHDENGIEVSHQIVIPSKISGNVKGGSSSDSENFVVISATGKDIFEANMKIQRRMSRRLMENHRMLIAISEEYFEKHDISKLFDKLNRDPANNLSNISIMIKGGRAKDFLMNDHPLEHLSTIAAQKEMDFNGMKNFSSRQLVIDYLSEGSRPLVPVFNIKESKVNNKETKQIAFLFGFAILDKNLKVKGIMDDVEGSEVAWMAGKETFQGVTIPWKDGNGTLSFKFTQLKRQIYSNKGDDKNRIILSVKAQAYLIENTTSLDMFEVDNIIEVQKYLNEQIQKELQETVDKVQEWGPDVFGIGEHFHRKYPYWWKSKKGNWEENFKEIDVKVKPNIRIRSFGTGGERLK